MLQQKMSVNSKERKKNSFCFVRLNTKSQPVNQPTNAITKNQVE